MYSVVVFYEKKEKILPYQCQSISKIMLWLSMALILGTLLLIPGVCSHPLVHGHKEENVRYLRKYFLEKSNNNSQRNLCTEAKE